MQAESNATRSVLISASPPIILNVNNRLVFFKNINFDNTLEETVIYKLNIRYKTNQVLWKQEARLPCWIN